MTIACLKCYLLTTPQGTVGYTRHIDVFRCIAAHNCTVGSDHWSGLQLQLLIVAGYQPGCSTFRLLHNNATHLVLQGVSNTNTQIHKYKCNKKYNAAVDCGWLLHVPPLSQSRTEIKTLHAALNTVQLKQCVCSLFTEQCVCCR